jgi:hypothetical protein
MAPGEGSVGEQAKPEISFILGMLSGAGLPVISRALKAGRTTGERAANAGPMNPKAILSQISGQSDQAEPSSLMDILPALIAKLGPGLSGLKMDPSLAPPMPPPGMGF